MLLLSCLRQFHFLKLTCVQTANCILDPVCLASHPTSPHTWSVMKMLVVPVLTSCIAPVPLGCSVSASQMTELPGTAPVRSRVLFSDETTRGYCCNGL